MTTGNNNTRLWYSTFLVRRDHGYNDWQQQHTKRPRLQRLATTTHDCGTQRFWYEETMATTTGNNNTRRDQGYNDWQQQHTTVVLNVSGTKRPRLQLLATTTHEETKATTTHTTVVINVSGTKRPRLQRLATTTHDCGTQRFWYEETMATTTGNNNTQLWYSTFRFGYEDTIATIIRKSCELLTMTIGNNNTIGAHLFS
jgi:ribosomal protein L19E